MPPNPQICLLSSANFIMLTPWFQGTRGRKTSTGHLLSSSSSRSGPCTSPSTPIPVGLQHPKRQCLLTCSNERVLVPVSALGETPRLLGSLFQACLWAGQCLRFLSYFCPSLGNFILMLLPREGQGGLLSHTSPCFSVRPLLLLCPLLQERIRILLTEVNYYAIILK